jgi:hypothetical protein
LCLIRGSQGRTSLLYAYARYTACISTVVAHSRVLMHGVCGNNKTEVDILH